MNSDRHYMFRALTLARRGAGSVSPNPMVGAIVVKDSKILGTGWHQHYGEAHAEVNALAKAGAHARGATLYITLEPCNHTGTTPPCTDAIIKAGISRVVIAQLDPNPDVPGKGSEALRARGIEVTIGVLETEAKKLNDAWLYYLTTGLPFITVKLALTAEDTIATTWVTSDIARAHVHRLRAASDAVMVGANTVLKDNPTLTNRLVYRATQPARVVVDVGMQIPLDARVLAPDGAPVFLVETNAPPVNHPVLERAQVIVAPGSDDLVDLRAALRALASAGIRAILCEGGATLARSILRERLARRVLVYRSGNFARGVPFPMDLITPAYQLVETHPLGPESLSIYECA